MAYWSDDVTSRKINKLICENNINREDQIKWLN